MKLGSYWSKENLHQVDCLTDDAPQWLRDAVYAPHDGDGPRDWIYTTCRAVCDAIDDTSIRDDDDIGSWSDSYVDIYTSDLAKWYEEMWGSSVFSQAEEEAFENSRDHGSISEQLGRIQYYAIERIAHTIWTAYEAREEGESNDPEQE